MIKNYFAKLDGNCESDNQDCNNKWRSKGAKAFKKRKNTNKIAKASRRKNRNGV